MLISITDSILIKAISMSERGYRYPQSFLVSPSAHGNSDILHQCLRLEQLFALKAFSTIREESFRLAGMVKTI